MSKIYFFFQSLYTSFYIVTPIIIKYILDLKNKLLLKIRYIKFLLTWLTVKIFNKKIYDSPIHEYIHTYDLFWTRNERRAGKYLSSTLNSGWLIDRLPKHNNKALFPTKNLKDDD